jgi:hypothetical protein
MNEDETGAKCGMNAEKRNSYRVWWGNLMQREHLEDLVIDGR